MIKDLELMKDITPLFKKRIVIWGMGQKGRAIMQEIVAISQSKIDFLLCDSNSNLWGTHIEGTVIYSPEKVRKLLLEVEPEEIMILVTVCSILIQEEIIKNIYNLYGTSVNICTEYAVEWGIYLGINNSYVDDAYRKTKLAEREKARITHQEMNNQEIISYFEQVPMQNDEIILIYQPGKVASTSVYKSIQQYNRHVFHCHTLDGIVKTSSDLYQFLNMKSGKIISIVREPIARQIAAMWQNIHNINRYSAEVDFEEIENYYFKSGFENTEYNWFNDEIKRYFDIDIFEHPFDREKGYSIIKQGNIQLLLMKMEKINELEGIIGDFLEIDSFELRNSNIGGHKSYRYALQSFKDSFAISQKTLKRIYEENKFVKYFYTEQERQYFYEKWIKCACKNSDTCLCDIMGCNSYTCLS